VRRPGFPPAQHRRLEVPMTTYGLTERAIVLRAEDDVAIVKKELAAGDVLEDGDARIDVRQDVKPGHKVARRPVGAGRPVRRYGQVIGFATRDIAAGDHVHSHNLDIGELSADRYEVGVDVVPVSYYPADQMRHFDGFKREDGRVGTRNYVAIVSGVNCSASVSQFVKDRFRDVPRDYPNVDGVIAVTHKSGCGTKLFGEDHLALQRVLAGYAKHPNVAAYILVGLGCEVNQAVVMIDRQKMSAPGHPERKPFLVNIQEAGGIRKTVERAAAEVARLLPAANAARRTRQPVSELVLATNCGGSDGNSGITANPALGWAVDELVRYGGTGVLAETPEIYGAEHLLIRRAIDEGVAKKLIDRYRWWEWYCRGIEAMDNNPAPGNKAGGITTVFEKSLGGVTKGGTTPMMDVFLYGEPITTRGFVFMDTPGHDPVSITGLVAGGCNVICFTTGRGSVFGCKPVPSIKLATNSLMYRHMAEDMDVNCGVILEGAPLASVGRQIFEEVIAVASGKRSKSELSGVGEEEFAPWIIGPVM
jgi:altronate hydrolase